MMQPVLTRSTSAQESSAASASRVRDGMSMASVAASVTASFARGLVASERAAQLRSVSALLNSRSTTCSGATRWLSYCALCSAIELTRFASPCHELIVDDPQPSARVTAAMATALEGKGAVPDIPLFGAVVKRLFELPTAKTFASNGLPVHWPAGFDFTADGLSAQVPAPHAQRPSRQLFSGHAPRLKPRALTLPQAPDARRSVMYAASPRRLTPACVPACHVTGAAHVLRVAAARVARHRPDHRERQQVWQD